MIAKPLKETFTVLDKEFKIYNTIEEPLFLAKDVANWIEHNQVARMIDLVDEDEKLKCLISTSGQNREMWFLTEDGVYEVLMQSRKPIAKQFKKGVKKILKEIRLNDFYIKEQITQENMDKLINKINTLRQNMIDCTGCQPTQYKTLTSIADEWSRNRNINITTKMLIGLMYKHKWINTNGKLNVNVLYGGKVIQKDKEYYISPRAYKLLLTHFHNAEDEELLVWGMTNQKEQMNLPF